MSFNPTLCDIFAQFENIPRLEKQYFVLKSSLKLHIARSLNEPRKIDGKEKMYMYYNLQKK
jgi:hypothetical protein